MQSFGEQHIEVESFSRAGTVRVTGIYSDAALYPRLGVRLEVTVRDIPPSGGSMPQLTRGGLDNYEVTVREGELRLDNGGPLVGLLVRTQASSEFRSSLNDSGTQAALACDLDLPRLEAIERHRGGRSAMFSLVLWPTAAREGKPLRAGMGPLSFEIPHERWIRFLSDVKYGEYEIIEMKRPAINGQAFAEVRAQLELARQRVMNGQYNSALVALRTGLDRFYVETRANGRPPIQQMLARVTDDERGAAYATIMKQVKEVCHRAAHKPESSIPITRAEALFVLRTAENCMTLVGDLVAKQNDEPLPTPTSREDV